MCWQLEEYLNELRSFQPFISPLKRTGKQGGTNLSILNQVMPFECRKQAAGCRTVHPAKGKPAFSDVPPHKIERLLDRYRTDIAEQCLNQI